VLLTVLANGVVGGLAVLGDLHPFLVQSHFLLAMVSIAFGLIAVRAASESRIPWRTGSTSNRFGVQLLGVVGLTAAALATGTVVTGAGPHAGEEDVRRYGFDIGTVARIHSVTVILAVACGAWLAVTVARHARVMQGSMSTWLFIAIVQGGIGYAQYFTGVPELLVGLHIAGATLLWVATVRLGLSGLDAASETGSPGGNTSETERLFGSTTTTV
jgi:cytochrome c oxidase assembly protein subunit 15